MFTKAILQSRIFSLVCHVLLLSEANDNNTNIPHDPESHLADDISPVGENLLFNLNRQWYSHFQPGYAKLGRFQVRIELRH